MISLHHADCTAWLADYAARLDAGEDLPLFDSCVTDPPYHLASIVQRFGKAGSAAAKDRDGLYQRASRGFMGKEWDGGDVAFRPETWALVLRCLKPGAYLVAFSGTRTYHRMACAIEDAGFEVRDQLAWAYGSGFPKSHNVGGGWGTALKPAWEPICLARKPLAEKSVAAQVLATGTGALNIDGCRVEADDAQAGRVRHGGGIAGNGTSYELPDYQAPMPAGRWPANLIHDGSAEVLAGFPQEAGGQRPPDGKAGKKTVVALGNGLGSSTVFHGDNRSAARFFYSAKAGPLDRLGTTHATVKPVDLMRWLVRLVTPPGGHVLEPFAGSGTTGIACMAEGMACTMIELEADHTADIERKLAHLRGDGRHKLIEHDRRRDTPPPPPSDGLFTLLGEGEA